jgi:dihydrofolate reductase
MTQECEPVIAMMMAMDRNRLIGRDGQLPWHIPGELSYFKSVTMGKPVVMGRRTFDSIGKPLPGRPNIVVTRNGDWAVEGVHVAAGLDEALFMARALAVEATSQELMIIGGASLCSAAMPVTQRLYLTVVDHEFEGDTWLDSFHWKDWRVVSEDVRDPTTTGGLPVTYWVLEKA